MVAQVKAETFERVSIVPESDDSDPESVSLALATAHALEVQGDLREAARWLRRAAEEAEKGGNDLRVVTLARAAAELTSRIDSRPTPNGIQPPTPKPAGWSVEGPASARRPGPPPLPPSAPPAPPAATSSSVAPRPSAVPPSRPSAVPPPRPSAKAVAPTPAALPAPPISAAPAPTASVAPASTASVAPAPTTSVAPAPATSTPSVATLPAPPSDRISAPPSSSVRSSPPATTITAPELAIRVSVRGSVNEPGLFVIRRLEPGQIAPAGTTEAVLVFLNSSGK